MDRMDDILNVVRYFLSLYQLHLGAKKGDSALFVRADSGTADKNLRYQLRVKHGGQWLTRRLTVGPIGEDSGAKSKCYKAIYGDTVVIKLPPEQITNYSDYIAEIKGQAAIVDLLEPEIKCITPEVSVLLKNIPRFLKMVGDIEKDDPGLEKKLLKRLGAYSKLHNYLKINNNYAFFMNLSRYSFVGDVIADMHTVDESMVIEEIHNTSEALWDSMTFAAQYGKDRRFAWDQMNRIYDQYVKAINNLFKQKNPASSAPNYKLQEWFLTLFSEKKISFPPSEYPPEFANALNDLIENIIWDSREAIETYKKEINDHLKTNLFRRSRMKMGGLSANLLELLSLLKDNGVAIRDLKPDNMFIKGDSSRISLFLPNPNEYAIGVIDFETAIGINPSGKKFPQPLLGGTPAYATLSNFIVNELLRYLLGDIARVLHLQDWYATIGMIYNVVTGGALFEETKKLLPQIMAMMQRTPMDKDQLVNFFKTNSRLFWSSAARELKLKMEADKERLSAVQVPMVKSTKNVTRAIKQDILYENNKLNKKIYEHVISQNYFSSVKHKKRLFESSVSKIHDFIKVWKNPKNFPKVPRATKAKMLAFLKELHELKSQSEKNSALLDKFDGPKPSISVYDLLPLMFNTVRKGMYKDAWGALVEDAPVAVPHNAKEDLNYEATIVTSSDTGSDDTDYEATIVI
ncbi:hypothetical protein QUF75_08860 [Desulfococcaceae bacterium HSG7]|nr:hypothetical protein [Desulfococcaceae bacterium HSG7]